MKFSLWQLLLIVTMVAIGVAVFRFDPFMGIWGGAAVGIMLLIMLRGEPPARPTSDRSRPKVINFASPAVNSLGGDRGSFPEFFVRENQMQTTIAECRRLFRRFVNVRYWNYSLGVAIGLGLAIAGSQSMGGGYWVKSIAAVAAGGMVAVDVFTAVALHGYYRSMMQQSERLGDSQFAPSISPAQSIFLFSIAPGTAFAASSCAVIAFIRIF